MEVLEGRLDLDRCDRYRLLQTMTVGLSAKPFGRKADEVKVEEQTDLGDAPHEPSQSVRQGLRGAHSRS